MKSLFTFFIVTLLLGGGPNPRTTQKNNNVNDTISSFNTDTIKARLVRLNTKTPIDISYTPELEDLIKKYINKLFIKI